MLRLRLILEPPHQHLLFLCPLSVDHVGRFLRVVAADWLGNHAALGDGSACNLVIAEDSGGRPWSFEGVS